MKCILKVMNLRKGMARQKKIKKIDSTDNIELTKLKFHPTADQTGTYTYQAAKIISQYLKSLCNSEHTIKDKQPFCQIDY